MSSGVRLFWELLSGMHGKETHGTSSPPFSHHLKETLVPVEMRMFTLVFEECGFCLSY
jgi:hypothetical protein